MMFYYVLLYSKNRRKYIKFQTGFKIFKKENKCDLSYDK